MKHMNLQPLDSHGVDFSRVRMWSLNNWARHYRQTLVFSSIQEPQINSILTKHCANYRGQVPLPRTTVAVSHWTGDSPVNAGEYQLPSYPSVHSCNDTTF